LPDYVVALDAHEDVIEAFKELLPVKYLLCTQCYPSVFERLKDQAVWIFNCPQGNIEVADFWHASNYDTMSLVNAGGSVTLGTISLAIGLGMKDFHIFGFDCHTTDKDYADGIAGVGVQRKNFEVQIEDRVFKTNAPYISFAQQFFKLRHLAQKLKVWDSVKIYGDSLITAMSKEDLKG
jgi:hypothetical protein